MKIKDLYSLIKQQLKEQTSLKKEDKNKNPKLLLEDMQERGCDHGSPNGVFSPENGGYYDYNPTQLPVYYFQEPQGEFNWWGSAWSEDGNSIDSGCHYIEIDQRFICCNDLNEDNDSVPAGTNTFLSIPCINEDCQEFGMDNFGISLAGMDCYCPNKTTIYRAENEDEAYNGAGDYITGCFGDESAGYKFTLDDFFAWAGEMVPDGAIYSLEPECIGCTYQANSYVDVYNMTVTDQGTNATIESNDCRFRACNAPGYSNYFCSNQPTSYLGLGQELCEYVGMWATGPHPGKYNPDLMDTINEAGDCAWAGCLEDITPWSPIDYSWKLPNTNWACTTDFGNTVASGYNSWICDAGDSYTDENGVAYNGIASTYTPTNSSVNYTHELTNIGCNQLMPVFGCGDITMFNYDGDVNVATPEGESGFEMDEGNTYWTNETSNADPCCPFVYGCMDEDAYNFNCTGTPTENEEFFDWFNYTQQYDPDENYDAGAGGSVYADDDTVCISSALTGDCWVDVNTDDGTCCYVEGCMDPSMFNYDASACRDHVTDCCPYVYGCDDNEAINFNCPSIATTTTNNAGVEETTYGIDPDCWSYNWTNEYGGTSMSTLGYWVTGNCDEDVNTDDGTCCYIEGCMDSTMHNYDEDACLQIDTVCIPEILGCTDEDAYNYNCITENEVPPENWNAMGACVGLQYQTDSGPGYWPVNTDDGSCCLTEGCMTDGFFNYEPEACVQIDTVCEDFVYGCNDSEAVNYDESANSDDGNCCYVEGCTDSTMFNYNDLACQDDGSCIEIVLGCIDETAVNYNEEANTDDGSCIGVIEGCTNDLFLQSLGGNYSLSNNTEVGDGSCILEGCLDEFIEVNGVMTPTTNFVCDLGEFCDENNALITSYIGADGGTYTPTFTGTECYAFEAEGCTNPNYIEYSTLYSTGDDATYCENLYIDACVNAESLNFYCNVWESENFDVSYPCNDDTGGLPYFTVMVPDEFDPFDENGALNLISQGITPIIQGVECIPIIEGCTDSTMFNYNAAANTDDGSCESVVIGCTDETAFNYNDLANTNQGSCCYVAGCTTFGQFGYNAAACYDDGSCEDVVVGCLDEEAFNYDSEANTPPVQGSADGCCYIAGCTDNTTLEDGTYAMFNYNAAACYDDGSCEGTIMGCTNSEALNYDADLGANTDDGTCCYVEGCMTSGYYNFDSNACIQIDTICSEYVNGCTDETMFNYNPLANNDDGSCVAFVYGCTEEGYLEYDPSANTEDDSCTNLIYYGCTDDSANNYLSMYNMSCTEAEDGTGVETNTFLEMGDGTYYLDPSGDLEVKCEPCNYDLDNDGILDADEVEGCQDPNAYNYNENAPGTDPGVYGFFTNQDYIDGGCTYAQVGCNDPENPNYLFTLLNNGALSVTAPLYYNNATDNNIVIVNAGDNTDPCELVGGCLDPAAVNYGCIDANSFNNCEDGVQYDNGSCRFVGCTNPLASNYDSDAISSDVNSNYNGPPNIDNGTCVFDQYCPIGFDENGFIVENFICNSTETNEIGWAYASLCDFTGELPQINFNYLTSQNEMITPVDQATSWPQFNSDGTPIYSNIIGEDLPCGQTVTYGCMDNTAGLSTDPNTGVDVSSYHNNGDINGNGYYLTTNYDPNANMAADLDNNPEKRCKYNFCGDSLAYNYNATRPDGIEWIPDHDTNVLELCEYEGCGDIEFANPGDVDMTLPDDYSFYSSNSSGCQNGQGGTINSMWSTGDLSADDTSCCAKVGCMDNGDQDDTWWNFYEYQNIYSEYPINLPGFEGALNYNPEVNVQAYWNQTYACEYPLGCMNPDSSNYDPSAIIDDGTCENVCRYVKAEQCSPKPPLMKPYKGAYTFIWGCVHIAGEEPQVGDTFLGEGNIYDWGDDLTPPQMAQPMICGGVCGEGAQIVQQEGAAHGDVSFDPETGFQYRWNMNSSCWIYQGVFANNDGPNTCQNLMVSDPSSWMMDPNCDVIYGPNVPAGVINCTEWVPIAGVIGLSGDIEKPKPATVVGKQSVVYRVTQVDDRSPSAALRDYPEWPCHKRPPSKDNQVQWQLDEIALSRTLRDSLSRQFIKNLKNKK